MRKVNIFQGIITKNGLALLLIVLLQSTFSYASRTGEGYRLSKVVIDAGHGGKDPGAIGKKALEKDLVLAVSLKLGNYIQQAFPDVEVIYTRSEDVFIGLNERSELANSKGADLFISVHCNSNPNKAPFGAETFVMGIDKTNDNLEVAKRENAVITFEEDYTTKYEGYDPNSAESFIIFNLVQNTHLEQSLNLASYIQDEFRERALRKDRGVKQDRFLVLWKTTMPSVLVELGFLSNAKEEEYLISTQGQDHLASAIFRAFRQYKNDIEARSNFVVEENDKPTHAQPKSNPTNKQKGAATTSNKPSGSVGSKLEAAKTKPLASGKIPTELTYKVQVTSSGKNIPTNSPFFQKFEGIEEFFIDGLYKYYIGSKFSFAEIADFCSQVKEIFPDAFIVAFHNGKQIPLDQARKISTQ